MKILIIKTSALGDIIHTFPVLSYLRKRDPFAQIDWVVESSCAELVEAHPQVNRVLIIESKKWRKSPLRFWSEIKNFREGLQEVFYDMVFDLQGNIKSSLVLAQTRAQVKVGFGSKSVAEWPNLLFTHRKFDPPPCKNIREDYLEVVKGYFCDTTPFVIEPLLLRITAAQQAEVDAVLSDATLVCPGAAWPNKQLSLVQLEKFLKELDGAPYLFVWGSAQEREQAVQLASHFPGSLILDRMPLPQLQHVMARAKRVVAMDSLPLHLCGMTSTPTMSFFGPSLAEKYRPLGQQHQAIQGACPYGVVFDKRCPKLRTCPTGACLKENIRYH